MDKTKYIFTSVVLLIPILLSSIFSIVVFEKSLAIGSQSLTTTSDLRSIQQTPDNITSSSKSYDWPMYQHDASHTGALMASFPDSVNLIWNKPYSDIIRAVVRHFSSPIVANGKVFIYGGCGKEAIICAFDENNGSQIWKREIHLSLFNARFLLSGGNSPAYSNGKLFVSIGRGASLGAYLGIPGSNSIRRCWSSLLALDENTGDIVWKKTFLGSSAHCSVIVVEGKVIVGGHLTFQLPLSMIYVYDENNGKLLWSRNMLGFLESTPVASDNKVFVVTGSHSGTSSLLERFYIRLLKKSRIYAFDINNGKRLWMKPVEGYAMFSSPAAGNGKLFIPSNIIVNKYRHDRKIYALDQETGEEIWQYDIEQKYSFNWLTSISTPSLAYGKVFVADADGWLYALDEDNGDMVWEREIIKNSSDYFLWANPVISPVVVDGKVIAHAQREGARSQIYTCMFNESNGKLIWSMKVYHHSEATGPFAVANEKLFINDSWDAIFAYG